MSSRSSNQKYISLTATVPSVSELVVGLSLPGMCCVTQTCLGITDICLTAGLPSESIWAFQGAPIAVREFANKSAASAASPDYIKFQAVIKSAASAASLHGDRASGRLDHGFFSQFWAALAAKKLQKNY